jgi:hypothetical protein
MISNTSLFSHYISLVGFRQSTDNCTPRIHPSLLGARLAVDSVNVGSQFLKAEYIYECIDRFNPVFQQRFDAWDVLTTYNIGDMVAVNGDVFVALESSTGVIPSWDAPEWETDLSSYLRQTYNDALDECVADVIASSNNDAFEQTLINNSPIYIQKDMAVLEVPSGRFVGHRVMTNQNQHIKSIIRNIGINLTTAQSLDIYTFSSLQESPIQVATINHTNANSYEVHEVDIDLTYINGGGFWIGFFESDLVDSYKSFERYSYYKAKEQWYYSPIALDASTLNGTDRPNVDLRTCECCEQVAFNIEVTECINYDPLIIRAKKAFTKVMQYNIAIRIIRDMAGTDNENQKTSLIRDKASEILDGGFADTRVGLQRISKGLLPLYEEFVGQIKMDICYLNDPFIKNNYGF